MAGFEGFEDIQREFRRSHLDAHMSFDAFLASADVSLAGLGTSGSGEHRVAIMSRLMDGSTGQVVWEVIPERTHSLGTVGAPAGAVPALQDRPCGRLSRDWLPSDTGSLQGARRRPVAPHCGTAAHRLASA